MAQFLFATCQIGAEKAVKDEVARRWKGFRFAFSRPGFLTFKLPPDHGLADDFDLESVFARAYGFSLGGVIGGTPEELAAGVWKSCKGRTVQRIHVWQRDRAEPGERGFEPRVTPAAVEAHRMLFEQCPNPKSLAKTVGDAVRAARTGELVLDCIHHRPQ